MIYALVHAPKGALRGGVPENALESRLDGLLFIAPAESEHDAHRRFEHYLLMTTYDLADARRLLEGYVKSLT